MITDGRRLLNAVNSSTYRWKRNGHQRRYSVTDLHGVEYTASMNKGIPAQFYTSVSFDFDRFIHWWVKVIVKPYQLKDAIKEGGAVDGFAGWDGSTAYDGGALNYGGNSLAAEHLRAILKFCKERGLLPSGVIAQLYSESWWGNSAVGRTDNNWSGMTGGAGTRPSGVVVTTGMARPANEGGTYMHYASVEDFLNDYTYLLAMQTAGNNQKMYAVQGKTTFPEFIKGLFRVGGALYDYAAAGYDAYLNLMNGVRAGINSSNGNVLDQLDDQILNGKSDEGAEVDPDKAEDKDGKTKKEAEKVNEVLREITSLKGQTVGSGECYGLAALYSQRLGGPGIGGGVTGISDAIGDTYNAANIGTGYDWGKHGWSVTSPTSVEQLVAGAIVTIKANAGGPIFTGSAGHVAIIKELDKENDRLVILQQNDSGRRFVTEDVYSASGYLTVVNHIILPPDLADGAVAGVSGGLSSNRVVRFPTDIKIHIDGIDFTPMFKAQYDGKWIDSYAIFPNDKPADGYDIMLAAAGLDEEQLKKVFSAGEHLVEVSGSMAADVTLRVYLKYNHLN